MATQHDDWVRLAFGVTVEPGSDSTEAGGRGRNRRPHKPREPHAPRTTKPATPKGPVPRAELGGVQKDRAGELLAKMSPADQQKVSKIINAAAGEEKKYLTKALASSHNAGQLEAFAKKIAGKDHKWMEENLHLVGGSDGKGIKQQWRCSCVPTMVEAMKGELDPIYALKMREENPDLTEADDTNPAGKNRKMAEDQRQKLVAGGGIPTSRAGGGKGMNFDKILDDQKGTTGLVFQTKAIGAGGTTVDQAMNGMETALKGGLPVPLRISNVGNPDEGHAVLCTGVDKGPPRRYSIHDPWDGVTVVVTEDDIKNDKFKIAGYSHISHIFQPSAGN